MNIINSIIKQINEKKHISSEYKKNYLIFNYIKEIEVTSKEFYKRPRIIRYKNSYKSIQRYKEYEITLKKHIKAKKELTIPKRPPDTIFEANEFSSGGKFWYIHEPCKDRIFHTTLDDTILVLDGDDWIFPTNNYTRIKNYTTIYTSHQLKRFLKVLPIQVLESFQAMLNEFK